MTREYLLANQTDDYQAQYIEVCNIISEHNLTGLTTTDYLKKYNGIRAYEDINQSAFSSAVVDALVKDSRFADVVMSAKGLTPRPEYEVYKTLTNQAAKVEVDVTNPRNQLVTKYNVFKVCEQILLNTLVLPTLEEVTAKFDDPTKVAIKHYYYLWMSDAVVDLNRRG